LSLWPAYVCFGVVLSAGVRWLLGLVIAGARVLVRRNAFILLLTGTKYAGELAHPRFNTRAQQLQQYTPKIADVGCLGLACRSLFLVAKFMFGFDTSSYRWSKRV